jgi:hypothetical protein
MPCHAMHPIQDLFLESFSYVLQIDMYFICTPMWTKKFILVKSGCYSLQLISSNRSMYNLTMACGSFYSTLTFKKILTKLEVDLS